MGIRLSELLKGAVSGLRRRDAVGDCRVAPGAEQLEPCSAPKARRWQRASSQRPRRLSGAEIVIGDDGALPTEMRLFRPGINPSRNGPVLFDDEAARKVMEAYRAHALGPDGHGMRRPVMIDLEHLAVEGEPERQGVARVPELNPLDARGWCALELRSDGSLWAVDVEWTEDGATRIREKRQRSISPAFWWETLNDGTERVIEIESIGLTAKPATDGPYGLNSSRPKGQQIMTLQEFLKRWGALSKSQRSIPAGDKLLKLLAIDMKMLQGVVKAMGGDPAGDITSLFATVRQFADELAAAVTGEPMPEPAMPAEGEGGDMLQANPEDKDEQAAMTRKLTKAVADQGAELAKAAAELAKLRAERQTRIDAEVVELCRHAIRTDALRPGQVWEGGKDGDPQAYLTALGPDGIRSLIKGAGKPLAPSLLSVTPQPARNGVIATADEEIEIHDFEIKRLHATVDRLRSEAGLGQTSEHDYRKAEERYRDHRGQQLVYARNQRQDMVARYGRKIEPDMVLSTVTGQIVRNAPKLLSSTPVKPIEQFGPASQRALEEFRLEYLDNLAAALDDWTTRVGDQLSSGAMDLSFPLHFQTTEYQERTAQGAATSTPQSADIKVQQREWDLAMQANLKRMMRGDFAYIRSWQQQGAQMARSRIKVRRKIVIEELESNPVWAVTKDKPNGLDGKTFFAVDHLVNPYKPSLGTHSNLSIAGHPLAPISTGADSLTLEQATWPEVPDWDNVDMEQIASDLMVPTNLGYYARQLLDVKEAILRGALVADSGAGVGTMGTEPNEHKDSGVSWFTAAPMSKDGGLNANWYMLSMPIINAGKKPWVLCEGSEEEIREWGTDSDFYKNGPGDIKVQSCIELCIVLLYWQGIRKVLAVAP